MAASLETVGVRAGESMPVVGSMAAFSSGWATTEAPNVVCSLEAIVSVSLGVESVVIEGVWLWSSNRVVAGRGVVRW